MTLTDFLKNDPDWQAAKMNTEKIQSDKIMTKVEYLKYIGWKNFTESGYKEYLQKLKNKMSMK